MKLPSKTIQRIFLTTLFIAVVSALVSSCSEDPTAQNAIVAPSSLPGVSFRDTTIFATQDSTFLLRLPMDGATDLIGGGAGYSASAILRFSPPISSIDTGKVISATLRLYITYHDGPPGSVSFNTFKVTRAWDPSTVTWDSVQTDFYTPTSPLPPVSQSVPADSQYITIPLDTAMVRLWIQTPDAADLDRYGIMLVPTSGTSSILGFHSFSADSVAYYPTLTVVTLGPNTTAVDTTIINSGLATFVGDCSPPTDAATLTLQAGVVYRSWLGFDVSFLHQGFIVNSAELLVDRMNSPSFNTVLTDSTVSAHLVTGTTLNTYEVSGSVLSPVSASSTTLSGDARHIVQSWVHGPSYGVLLRTSSNAEFNTFDRVQLSGIRSTNAVIRPRLHLVYSIMSLEKKP
ncbi:MAG: DNRLRE domain-containing protein [Bacteroidota bacterium]